MELHHGQDPERSATWEGDAQAGRLLWQDAQGKLRKKALKARAVGNAVAQGLELAVSMGFVAHPGGPLRWVCAHAEPLPHGFPFALDRSGGWAWLGDSGLLRRVELATGNLVELPLPGMARALGCDGEGRVSALVDLASLVGEAGPFRSPATGPGELGLWRQQGASGGLLWRLPWPTGARLWPGLSVARDGRLLGPAEGGVGLYSALGEQTAVWPCPPGLPPLGALSPGGAQLLRAEGEALVHQVGGQERRLPAPFEQLLDLHLTDEGDALAAAFGAEGWGLYRLGPGGWIRLVDDVYARPLPDGRLASFTWGWLRLFDGEGGCAWERELPDLPFNRHGRVMALSERELVLRTDRHALALVELD